VYGVPVTSSVKTIRSKASSKVSDSPIRDFSIAISHPSPDTEPDAFFGNNPIAEGIVPNHSQFQE
jgi:hypothetical protein